MTFTSTEDIITDTVTTAEVWVDVAGALSYEERGFGRAGVWKRWDLELYS